MGSLLYGIYGAAVIFLNVVMEGEGVAAQFSSHPTLQNSGAQLIIDCSLYIFEKLAES